MVRINGADLYYETAGNGDALVLIHGFSMDQRMWDDQFREFADRCRVVRYDARGFGRSSLPTTGVPYSHAGDLEALLDHLGIGQAALMGFSMGAEIALELALAAPQRVARLVLCGAFLHDFVWQSFKDDYRPVRTAAKASGVGAAKAVWMTLPIFEPAMGRPRAATRLARMISDYSGWHFTHRDSHRHVDPPVSRCLQRIDTRTLVAVGEEDLEDFHAIAGLLQSRMPNAVKIDIPDSGHCISLENPGAFNRQVGRFLAGACAP